KNRSPTFVRAWILTHLVDHFLPLFRLESRFITESRTIKASVNHHIIASVNCRRKTFDSSASLAKEPFNKSERTVKLSSYYRSPQCEATGFSNFAKKLC